MTSHSEISRHLSATLLYMRQGKEAECKWFIDYYNQHHDKASLLDFVCKNSWDRSDSDHQYDPKDCLSLLLKVESISCQTAILCLEHIQTEQITGRMAIYCISEIRLFVATVVRRYHQQHHQSKEESATDAIISIVNTILAPFQRANSTISSSALLTMDLLSTCIFGLQQLSLNDEQPSTSPASNECSLVINIILADTEWTCFNIIPFLNCLAEVYSCLKYDHVQLLKDLLIRSSSILSDSIDTITIIRVCIRLYENSGNSMWCSVLRQLYSQINEGSIGSMETLFEQLLNQSPTIAVAILSQLEAILDKVSQHHIIASATEGDDTMVDISLHDVHILLLISRSCSSSDIMNQTSNDEFFVPMLWTSNMMIEDTSHTDHRIFLSVLFYRMLIYLAKEPSNMITITTGTMTSNHDDDIFIALSIILREVLFGKRRSTSWLPMLRCKDILSFAIHAICYINLFHDIFSPKLNGPISYNDNHKSRYERMVMLSIITVYQDIPECQANVLHVLMKATLVLASRIASYHPTSKRSSQANDSHYMYQQQISSLSIILKLLNQLSVIVISSSSSSTSSHIQTYSSHTSNHEQSTVQPISSVFIRIMQEHFPSLLSLPSQSTCNTSTQQILEDWLLEMLPSIARTSPDFYICLLNYLRKTLYHNSLGTNSSDQYKKKYLLRVLVALICQLHDPSFQLQATQALVHAFRFPLSSRRYLYSYLRDAFYDCIAIIDSNNHNVKVGTTSTSSAAASMHAHHAINNISKPSIQLLLHHIQQLLLQTLSKRLDGRKRCAALSSQSSAEPLELDFQKHIRIIHPINSEDAERNIFYFDEDIRQLLVLEGLGSIILNPQSAVGSIYTTASTILQRARQQLVTSSTQSDADTIDHQHRTSGSTYDMKLSQHMEAILFSIAATSSDRDYDINAANHTSKSPTKKQACVDIIVQMAIQADILAGVIEVFEICRAASSCRSYHIATKDNIIHDTLIELRGTLDVLFDTISSSTLNGSIKTYDDLDKFISLMMTSGISSISLSSDPLYISTYPLRSGAYELVLLQAMRDQVSELSTVHHPGAAKTLSISKPYSMLLGGLMRVSSSLKQFTSSQPSCSSMVMEILNHCYEAYDTIIRPMNEDSAFDNICDMIAAHRSDYLSSTASSQLHTISFTSTILSNLEAMPAELHVAQRYDILPFAAKVPTNRYIKLVSNSLKLQLLAARAEILEVIAHCLCHVHHHKSAMSNQTNSLELMPSYGKIYWAKGLSIAVQRGISLRSYTAYLDILGLLFKSVTCSPSDPSNDAVLVILEETLALLPTSQYKVVHKLMTVIYQYSTTARALTFSTKLLEHIISTVTSSNMGKDNHFDEDEDDDEVVDLLSSKRKLDLDATYTSSPAITSSQHQYAGEGYYIIVPEHFKSLHQSTSKSSQASLSSNNTLEKVIVDDSSILLKPAIIDGVLDEILIFMRHTLTNEPYRIYDAQDTSVAQHISSTIFMMFQPSCDVSDDMTSMPINSLSSTRQTQLIVILIRMLQQAIKEYTLINRIASYTKKSSSKSLIMQLNQTSSSAAASHVTATSGHGTDSASSLSSLTAEATKHDHIDTHDHHHISISDMIKDNHMFIASHATFIQQLLEHSDSLGHVSSWLHHIISSLESDGYHHVRRHKLMKCCQLAYERIRELQHRLRVTCSSPAMKQVITHTCDDMDRYMSSHGSNDNHVALDVYKLFNNINSIIQRATSYIKSHPISLLTKEGVVANDTAGMVDDKRGSSPKMSNQARDYPSASASRGKKRKARSRNRVIDDWLGDENGSDNYADLEDFVVP